MLKNITCFIKLNLLNYLLIQIKKNLECLHSTFRVFDAIRHLNKFESASISIYKQTDKQKTVICINNLMFSELKEL